MAENSTAFTAPSSTVKTELWYKTKKSGATLTQVFGVQAIPAIETAKEDITYRCLESSIEFATSGISPHESIEIECIGYPEQLKAIDALEGTGVIDWYVKLPDTFKEKTGTKAMVVHWEGDVSINISEIALDDMIKTTLKIGKSSVPEIIDGLPTS